MPHFNIHIEPTSNKNIVKFTANSFLTDSGHEFKNIDEAKPSPLAQQLFYLPFVKTVYISQNFIAIEKYEIVAWEDVQAEVAESIESYLNSGKEIFNESVPTQKKIPVTVYAESTPNPAVMKFVANKTLAPGTFEFKNIDESRNAPLATALFSFPFVKEVFISANYVSVMKYNVAEWEDITMEVREHLRAYLESGKTVLKDELLLEPANTGARQRSANGKVSENASGHSPAAEVSTVTYSELENEIVSILEEYVKPAVASDGGHIAFESYNESSKTVKVILQGACSGCPSSTFTLKNGIQAILAEMLPGKVLAVEAING